MCTVGGLGEACEAFLGDTSYFRPFAGSGPSWPIYNGYQKPTTQNISEQRPCPEQQTVSDPSTADTALSRSAAAMFTSTLSGCRLILGSVDSRCSKPSRKDHHLQAQRVLSAKLRGRDAGLHDLSELREALNVSHVGRTVCLSHLVACEMLKCAGSFSIPLASDTRNA